MLRYLTFLDEAAGVEMILPVTPSSYSWTHANAVETIQLDQLGEVNLHGTPRMAQETVDCLLPAQAYPFLNPGAGTNPWVYLERLERWSDSGTVLRYLVSGTPLNAAVLIESIQYGEQDGTNDLYASITLRQYQAPESPTLPPSGGSAATSRTSSTGGQTARTYTVQKGDNLWNIARKFYGDGSKYPRIVSANSIKNPQLIYPGTVLTIPAL